MIDILSYFHNNTLHIMSNLWIKFKKGILKLNDFKIIFNHLNTHCGITSINQ